MGSLVFITALTVGIAVMAWYFACEAAGSDGDSGLLALRAAPEGKPAAPHAIGGGDDSSRYRARDRLSPGHRGGLRAAALQKSYRVKAQGVPAYRRTGDGGVETGGES